MTEGPHHLSGDVSAESASPTGTVAVTGQREYEAQIVEREPLLGDASLMTLRLPAGIASRFRPGQFVQVRSRDAVSTDPLLRRPYSPYRINLQADTLALLVRPFGRASTWLATQPVGEVINLMGPLGNGFSVPPKAKRILMVAGGVGVAPLVHLTEEVLPQDHEVTFLMGAATGSALLPANELPSEVEYVVATDDGTQGHHGFVTDLVAPYLSWTDAVFACGPEPMLRSLSGVVRQHRFGRQPPVSVSVEQSMACGVGVCLGCMVETTRGWATTCVDGPVFHIDDIVW
jgi:dihydroorotate dehydrogenase electron transfer subunit